MARFGRLEKDSTLAQRTKGRGDFTGDMPTFADPCDDHRPARGVDGFNGAQNLWILGGGHLVQGVDFDGKRLCDNI